MIHENNNFTQSKIATLFGMG